MQKLDFICVAFIFHAGVVVQNMNVLRKMPRFGYVASNENRVDVLPWIQHAHTAVQKVSVLKMNRYFFPT